jgi:hypothetical protein
MIIVNAIHNWKPAKQYSKETEYRDDLAEYLRDTLNYGDALFGSRATVSKEKGKGLCDIAINGNEYGIELKRNFKSNSEVTRVMGQILQYQKEYDHIIIVLCGVTNLDKLDDLKTRISGLQRPLIGPMQLIKVIDKGTR